MYYVYACDHITDADIIVEYPDKESADRFISNCKDAEVR